MSVEKTVHARSGWPMLALLLAVVALCVALIVTGATMAPPDDAPITTATQTLGIALLVAGIVAVCVAPVLLLMGFFTIQPNQARVLILFGDYKGTVRDEGFHWANPFYSRNAGSTVDVATGKPIAKSTKVSLRARTYNGEHLKVNDKCGNPIEIADVIVWRVENTAKALFDVDDYNTYVHTQSETALRHVATTYAYDQMPGEPEGEITLRSNIEEVSEALKEELAVRLEKAGVVIDDARLTHLAYAPEIAQAMLRRQQAEAVIAAREKIVQGAVSMVDMALAELSAKNVVDLDDERKAAMVSNLMVVLCGESDAQPVLNTGTLYQEEGTLRRGATRRAAASVASYGEAKTVSPAHRFGGVGRHRTVGRRRFAQRERPGGVHPAPGAQGRGASRTTAGSPGIRTHGRRRSARVIGRFRSFGQEGGRLPALWRSTTSFSRAGRGGCAGTLHAAGRQPPCGCARAPGWALSSMRYQLLLLRLADGGGWARSNAPFDRSSRSGSRRAARQLDELSSFR
ncbi:MAG: SPFH domain-containing protein [Eggerthella lenta]